MENATLISVNETQIFIYLRTTLFSVGLNAEAVSMTAMDEEMQKKSVAIVATKDISDIAKSVYTKLCAHDGKFTYIDINTTTFANAELKPVPQETVRKKDVYLFHSLYYPDPNTGYMTLFFAIDALSRASANSISLVLPYMSYTRQDRKDEARAPISARALADLTQVNRKVERIITMDLHAPAEEGFYTIPVDNLRGAHIHQEYLRTKWNNDFNNVVFVSPDVGSATRVRDFGAKLVGNNFKFGMLYKVRPEPNRVDMLYYIGEDVAGKDVVFCDDMIDTGGSVIAAGNSVRARGAKSVYVCATHAVFSKKGTTCEEKFKDAGIEVLVTDSIPRNETYKAEHENWLTVLPIDNLLAETIHQICIGGSVSSIFKKK